VSTLPVVHVHMLPSHDADVTLCGLPSAGHTATPETPHDRTFCDACDAAGEEGRAYPVAVLPAVPEADAPA